MLWIAEASTALVNKFAQQAVRLLAFVYNCTTCQWDNALGWHTSGAWTAAHCLPRLAVSQQDRVFLHGGRQLLNPTDVDGYPS